MNLDQIIKTTPAKAVAAGLIAGVLYLASTVTKKPEPKQSYSLDFQELGIELCGTFVPRQVVFEDEKTYRKFANLASNIQESFREELKIRGLKGFGQKENYQIIEKIGKNVPYEAITAEQVDKAVYLWQKEGTKAFNVKIKTKSITNPNDSSTHLFEHDENGHYLVVDDYTCIKVESPRKAAKYIVDRQRDDPFLKMEKRGYYTSDEMTLIALKIADRDGNKEDITDKDLEADRQTFYGKK